MRPIFHIPKPLSWAFTIPVAIRAGRCARCGEKPGAFRQQLDFDEYRISAMCQSCQDDFFDENPKSAWDTSTDYGPREGA